MKKGCKKEGREEKLFSIASAFDCDHGKIKKRGRVNYSHKMDCPGETALGAPGGGHRNKSEVRSRVLKFDYPIGARTSVGDGD